jgi:predicted ATP-dependent serine protease
MEKFVNFLDMKNAADLLLATREDLEKCKLKVSDISDHTINMVYAESAAEFGIKPRNAFEILIKEMKNIVHFKTGDDELDRHLKEEGISSDELVEVCGSSGSGKTYFCLKMASLAVLDSKLSCLYIDSTNYVNHTNISLVLRNFMSQYDPTEKTNLLNEALTRFKI